MYESIQQLEAFAKDRHIPYFQNIVESKTPVANTSKMTSSKKEIYMKLHRHGREFYLGFFDSLGQSTNNKSLFTALYMVTNKQLKDVEIQKREWVDALRFKKRFRSGNEFIDKHVQIPVKPAIPLNRQLVDSFLSMQKEFLSLRFSMQSPGKHFIDELSDKNLLSVRVIEWVSDEKKLEFLMDKGCRMLMEFDR